MGFKTRKIENQTSPFLKGKKVASRPKIFFGPEIIDDSNRKKIFSKKIFIWLIAVLVVLLYITWGISHLLAPPKITIYSPQDNFVTEEKIITLKGRVSEKCLVTINNQIVDLDNQNVFEEKITLSSGVNTLKISAKKKIGRENTIIRQIILK